VKSDYFRSSELHVDGFAGSFRVTDSSPLGTAKRAGLEKEEVIKLFQVSGREEWRRRGINQSSIYGSCVSYGFLKGSGFFRALFLPTVNVNRFLVGIFFVWGNRMDWCLPSSMNPGKPHAFMLMYRLGCQI
jgi:hypothetical protein